MMKDIISGTQILSQCYEIRNGILQAVKELEGRAQIEDYLNHGDTEIYLEKSLDAEGVEESAEGSLSLQLFRFSQVLWRFIRARACTKECFSGVGPWLTYVVLSPSSSRHGPTRYQFYSFGIDNEEDPEEWYDFLEEQQNGEKHETFIVSSLLYSEWSPKKGGADTIFRIFYHPNSNREGNEFQDESFIDLHITDPHSNPEPLKLECHEDRHSDLRENYNQFWEEVFEGREDNIYRGLAEYIETINRFMGVDDRGWTLYGLPVPAFDYSEPKSGLYLLGPRAGDICPECRDILSKVSFLVSSTLWPLDHLRRQKRLRQERDEQTRTRKRLSDKFTADIEDIESKLTHLKTYIEKKYADQITFSLFCKFFNNLHSLNGDGLKNEIKDLRDVLEAGNVFRKTIEVIKDKNQSIKHIVTFEEKKRAGKVISKDAQEACREALHYYSNSDDSDVAQFGSKLAESFGVTVERGNQIWPLVMYSGMDSKDDQENILKKMFERLQCNINVPISVNVEIEGQGSGADIAIVRFIFQSIFRDDNRLIKEDSQEDVTVKFEGDKWAISWQTSEENTELGVHEGNFLDLRDEDDFSVSKLRYRIEFIRDLLDLEVDDLYLRIEDGNAKLHLRLDI